jgi:hypothetical protein
MNPTHVFKQIRQLVRSIEAGHRSRAAEMHEWEEKELRNIFALMVVGSFAGIPAPPGHITLELLPDMEKDVIIMMNRIQTAHDPLGELFSTLDPM